MFDSAMLIRVIFSQMKIEIEILGDPETKPPIGMDREWQSVQINYLQDNRPIAKSAPVYIPLNLPYELLERVINDAAGLQQDREFGVEDCMELNRYPGSEFHGEEDPDA
jgi:hypothetical protein